MMQNSAKTDINRPGSMLSLVSVRFDQYINGRECVEVRTDHKPLEAIFQK